MSEIILLGAGASKDAKLPDSFGMTQAIIEEFHKRSDYRQYISIANYVLGGLFFEEGRKGKNPIKYNINVEDFFNSILLLAERDNLEVTPFINSWHPMVEEFDKVTSHSDKAANLFRKLTENISHILSSKNEPTDNESFSNISALTLNTHQIVSNKYPITSFSSYIPKHTHEIDPSSYLTEKLLMNPHSFSVIEAKKKSLDYSQLGNIFQDAIWETQPKPGKGQVYQSMTRAMIHTLISILWISDYKRVNYLAPLVDLSKRQGRLVIASLNYDNSIELAAESQGIECNTGIENWSKKGFIDISSNRLHLLKLHGSIDWEWEPEEDGSVSHLFPQKIIKKVNNMDSKYILKIYQYGNSIYEPAVLFGHKNKLTANGPFLDLLHGFKSELMKDDTDLLTIIGYSFGDDHINAIVSRWLNQNPKHQIRIIDPGFKDNERDYVRHIKEIKKIRPKQVKIIFKTAKKAILDIYGN